MSTADRAAELRAQADALDALAGLETELQEAKAAYAADPTEETRQAKQDTARALRRARQLTRDEGVTVGGDAYVDEEI